MNWLNISCDERDCMIYLCLFKIFKILKSGPDLKKLGKMGKNEQKWLSKNPQLYTTSFAYQNTLQK